MGRHHSVWVVQLSVAEALATNTPFLRPVRAGRWGCLVAGALLLFVALPAGGCRVNGWHHRCLAIWEDGPTTVRPVVTPTALGFHAHAKGIL